MRILVTGGAGYVGSHAARLLIAAGHDVWIYDNLSQGHRGACPAGRLIEGELLDRPLLVEVLRSRKIEAVMHFAAFALVGESVADPAKYYQNNVVASLTLLEAMRASRRRADRLFQHHGHLRRARPRADHRGRKARADQSLRLLQAGHRARPGRLRPRLWLWLRRLAVFQRRRRHARRAIWAKITIPNRT